AAVPLSTTKYFRPLLLPGWTCHCHVRSKSPKVSAEMMSRLPRVAAPSAGGRQTAPSLTIQRRPETSGLLYPRQPAVVEPSKSNRQPAAFSAAVRVLGASDAPSDAPRAMTATATIAMREKKVVAIRATITPK